MTIEERINYFKEWIDYIKSCNEEELSDYNKKDLSVLEETVKDLEALESIKDCCGLVYEDGNTYFKVSIREYDYLRRPIDDFDKVKYLAERN